MIASVLRSSASSCCTAEFFCRRTEGNALGFDLETTVLEEVSFVEAPQSSQGMIDPAGPSVLGSRFPQASQKSIDQMATIMY